MITNCDTHSDIMKYISSRISISRYNELSQYVNTVRDESVFGHYDPRLIESLLLTYYF